MDEDVQAAAQVLEDMKKNRPFALGKQLGAGTYGQVFVTQTPRGTKVVKRILKRPYDDDPKMSDDEKQFYATAAAHDVKSEYTILKMLKPRCEQYIVCYDSFSEDADYYYLSMEYLENYSNLLDFPAEVVGLDRETRYARIQALAQNLVRGLRVIHGMGIKHRDIKPENILYSGTNIKYIDFGLSCVADRDCRENPLAGTPGHVPPEWVKLCDSGDKTRCGTMDYFKGDIWSLGCTLMELCFKPNTNGHYMSLLNVWVMENGTGPLEERAKQFGSTYLYGKFGGEVRKHEEYAAWILRGANIDLSIMLHADPSKRVLPDLQPLPEVKPAPAVTAPHPQVKIEPKPAPAVAAPNPPAKQARVVRLPTRVGNFTLGKEIGRGSFGAVFLATADGERAPTRVIKVISKASPNTKPDAVLRERNALQTLQPECKRYVVCFDSFTEDADFYYMSMEYLAPPWVLLDDVRPTHARPDLDARARVYLFQAIVKNLVRGMQTMHRLGISHRDVKPQNIMVNSSMIKYIDLGLGCVPSECAQAPLVGTPEYMAPEIAARVPNIDYTRSDIWALGCTIVEIALPHGPTREQPNSLMATWILGNWNPPPGATAHDHQKALMRQFWATYEIGKFPAMKAAEDATEQLLAGAGLVPDCGVSLRTMLVRDPAKRSLPVLKDLVMGLRS